MKLSLTFLALLFMLSLISSCSTNPNTGTKFVSAPPPNNNEALIYIYRPDSPPFWRSPSLFVNDFKITDLYNKGYTYLYLPQGKHTIKAHWIWDTLIKDLSLDIEVNAGQTIFVRLHSETDGAPLPGAFIIKCDLENISLQKAKTEISDLTLINSVATHLDPSKVK